MPTKRFYAVLVPLVPHLGDEVAIYDSKFDEAALFGWVNNDYGWQSAANVVDRLESGELERTNFLWDKV